ncbi:hypothetical protein A4G20_09280 [Pasteurellaceae bacterium RH1A]|nr:hypothetical protein A4G20_09280 [Pasteurellaceae bacterium RH1A]
MAKINKSLDELVVLGLDTISNLFHQTVVSQVTNTQHQNRLKALFDFALHNEISLFPKIKIEDSDDIKQLCTEYLQRWCKKYTLSRDSSALQRPLKNYGEQDAALLQRVSASTDQSDEILQYYLTGHYLYMSAENMNGAILEEYLAQVLESHGWYWCAGSVFRAVDFCYFNENSIILLQVKNKYNTENSSSSAIRAGTEIKKWNRLKRPKAGSFKPESNWQELHVLISANAELVAQLTEEKYLDYIQKNSTREIESLR